MDANAPAYAIIICTRCRDPISGALAAQELIARLAGPRAAGQGKAPRFRVETVACMAGCDRPLTVAFRAPEKAAYLFGYAASFTTALLVSVSGVIGFVGLMVPHLARAVAGPLHRRLAVASALFGAVLLLASDLAARTILPSQELPVGIVTNSLGAVFVVAMLLRR